MSVERGAGRPGMATLKTLREADPPVPRAHATSGRQVATAATGAIKTLRWRTTMDPSLDRPHAQVDLRSKCLMQRTVVNSSVNFRGVVLPCGTYEGIAGRRAAPRHGVVR